MKSYYPIFYLALCLAIVACSDQGIESFPKLEISTEDGSLSNSTINFAEEGGTARLNIASNDEWEIGSTADWVGLSAHSGSGNSNVVISVAASEQSRSAVVVVAVTDAPQVRHSFNVIQHVESKPDTPPSEDEPSEDKPSDGDSGDNEDSGDEGSGDEGSGGEDSGDEGDSEENPSEGDSEDDPDAPENEDDPDAPEDEDDPDAPEDEDDPDAPEEGESDKDDSGESDSDNEESDKDDSGEGDTDKDESDKDDSGEGDTDNEESDKDDSGESGSDKDDSDKDDSGEGDTDKDDSDKDDSGESDSDNEESDKDDSGEGDTDKDDTDSDTSGAFTKITTLRNLSEGDYYIGGYKNEELHLSCEGLSSGHCNTTPYSFSDGDLTPSGSTTAITVRLESAAKNGYYIYFEGSGYLNATEADTGALCFSAQKGEYWIFSEHPDGGFVVRQSGDIDVQLTISTRASKALLRSLAGDEEANAIILFRHN